MPTSELVAHDESAHPNELAAVADDTEGPHRGRHRRPLRLARHLPRAPLLLRRRLLEGVQSLHPAT